MENEFDQTLNSTVDDGPVGGSSDPANDAGAQTETEPGDLVNSPAEALNTDNGGDGGTDDGEKDGGKGKTPEGGEGEKPKPGEEQAGKDVPFHEHERWQEMLKDINTLKTENADLRGRLEKPADEGESNKPQGARDFEAEYAELDEKLAGGDIALPEYQKETREIQKAEREDFQQRQEQEQQLEVLKDQFLEEHSYINDILDSREGDISDIISKQPIHDEVSAALVLRIQDLETNQQQAIDEAVAKAVKETEEKVTNNFRAKRNARALGGGDARAITTEDNADLKDTSKAGGTTNVLASRLKRSRAAANG